MAYDYSYGELENKLIELFRSGAPDFEAAEELIRLGADINAMGKNDNKNILSEILSGYWWSIYGDSLNEACENCEEDCCDDCEHNRNPNLGQSMCAIIHFFLQHGFDVTKNDGCYGAQCLYALVLSTFDRYMIEATKILLDAGAKNRTVSPTSTNETPWGFFATEGSCQGTCHHNHASANIYEAVYQIYQAIEDGRPYRGIDSYEVAVGKKVLKVLAEKKGNRPIFFSMDLPEYQKDNCYNSTLYFVYDDGVLISTQYADFWTDTILPTADMVDVSDCFDGIVGNTIKGFSYDSRSIVKGTIHYVQPVTTIEMDSGHKVRFSVNFGEVKKENRVAFYEILNENDCGCEKIEYTLEEGEKLIQSKLKAIGTAGGLITGIMMMLEDNIDEDEDENTVITQRQNKLLQYMEFKGEHLTSDDVSLKLMQFVKENMESYLPNYMLLQYIGETTEELIHGEFYQPYVVYRLDEEYLITNETGEYGVYPRDMFRHVRAARIRFQSYDEDGSRTDDEKSLLPGHEYEVTEVKVGSLMHYRCNAGSCYPKECIILEAEPVPDVFKKKPFAKPQLPLVLLGKAIEFGCVRDLYNCLSDDCTYISEGSGKTITGALEIAQFFQKICQIHFERTIFCDTVEVIITESAPENRYPVGTECLMIRYSDDGQCVFAFVEHNESEINRIVLSCENYGFTEKNK